MFFSALFKNSEDVETTSVFIDGQMDKENLEYYSAIKRNEILPFTTTWIDLESVMLNEMSDRGRQIPYESII